MKKIVSFFVKSIGLVIFLMIIIGVITFFIPKNTEPPTVEKARYGIQTYSNDALKIPSRIYFTNSIGVVDGTTIIDGYWSYDGEKYKYHRDEKKFPIDEYGNIKIVDRRVSP